MKMSDKIRGMLSKEIMNQVESLGSVSFQTSHGDGIWAIDIRKDSVILYGYAAENLTSYFEKQGFTIIEREEYDQSSRIAKPQELLTHLSMSELAQLFESGEHELNRKNKKSL